MVDHMRGGRSGCGACALRSIPPTVACDVTGLDECMEDPADLAVGVAPPYTFAELLHGVTTGAHS